MNRIQEKRLLNVARALLESKAPQMFTMGFYVHGDAISKCRGVLPAEEFCGTPACALGHYGARRDLQRLLKIVSGPVGSDLVYGDGDWRVDFSSHLIRDHFGISLEEADLLFGEDGCGGARTAKEAALFIKRFVAKKLKAQRR